MIGVGDRTALTLAIGAAAFGTGVGVRLGRDVPVGAGSAPTAAPLSDPPAFPSPWAPKGITWKTTAASPRAANSMIPTSRPIDIIRQLGADRRTTDAALGTLSSVIGAVA